MLVILALVGACVPAPAAPASPSPASAADLDSLLSSLAAAGVEVFETPASAEPMRSVTAPVSPLRLTGWQVQNMAVELGGGTGFTADELDDLADLAADSLPLSFLLLGWLREHDSAPAREARSLLSGRLPDEPDDAVFPGVILTLFVADAAAQGIEASARLPQAAGPALAAVRPVAVAPPVLAAQVAGPCGAVAAWYEAQIDALFQALQASSDQWYASIWNITLSIFQTILKQPVSAAIDALLAPIKAALGVIGVLVHAASFLTTWNLSMSAEPTSNLFSVGSAPPNTGLVRTAVDSALQVEWPAWLNECAQAVNVTLPSAAATGAPVKWSAKVTKHGVLATTTSPLAGTLDVDQRAELSYRSGSEPTDEGAPETGHLLVQARVERMAVTELKKMLEATLYGLLPGVAGEIVNPIIKAQVQPHIDKLAALADLKGTAVVPITFHGLPEPTLEPPPAGAAPVCPGNPVRPGRWTGTFSHSHLVRVDADGASGVSTGKQKGTIELDITCAGGVSGELHSPTYEQPTEITSGDINGNPFTIDIECSGTDVRHYVSGTVSPDDEGLPRFDLSFTSTFGSYGCEGDSIPFDGSGSSTMVIQAYSHEGDRMTGQGVNSIRLASPLVPAPAAGEISQVQLGHWFLRHQGE